MIRPRRNSKPQAETEQVTIQSMFGSIRSYRDDVLSQQIEIYGNHTRPEFAFAQSVLDFDTDLFDLGAHIGTFTLAAFQKLRAGQRILAVEGSATTFELLRCNCQRRDNPAVDLENVFIGESQGFAYREPYLGNSGASRLLPVGDGEQSVQMVSIDDLAQRYFTPGYIKIDIEGAEMDALQNCNVLRTHRPILYIEVAGANLENFGHSTAELNDLLTYLGYQFFVNVGERNARHDVYRVKQIDSLDTYKPNFDALCVPAGSDKLSGLLAACEAT